MRQKTTTAITLKRAQSVEVNNLNSKFISNSFDDKNKKESEDAPSN